MRRAVVLEGVAALALGCVAASPVSAGCSSTSSGGASPFDASADATFPVYDGSLPDSDFDGPALVADAGEAGPLPILPKIYVVNASPDAPPLRFCLGFGPLADAGPIVAASLAPWPNHVAPGAQVAGLAPGFGAELDDYGLDLDTLTVDLFALDATNPIVAGDTADAGPDGGAEVPCTSLIGPDGRGSSADGGGVLQAGRDFFELGTIPLGQLGHRTTWVLAVIGCMPGETRAATLCPSGYDATTGDVSTVAWQIDNVTAIAPNTLGAQFAQASSEWDNFARSNAGTTVAGFFASADGGAVPVASDASFGTLEPKTLLGIPGLAFGGETAFFAEVLDGGGSAIPPTPFASPLVSTSTAPASVTTFTWGPSGAPEGGALRNGAGFVFVLVGNPAASSLYVNPADGGSVPGLDAGALNGHFPHFLAFPVANP